MTGFNLFLAIFGVSTLWFPGEGQLQTPADGSTLVFTNGSTARITWPYIADISKVYFRSWSFISRKTKKLETLATILGNGTSVVKFASSLHNVEVETPTTLILKNIDVTYDGTYQFVLTPSLEAVSEVVLYIAGKFPEKPTMSVNCSSPITANEGDDVRCVCWGGNGNPPPNVIWYKDAVKIGDMRHEQNFLTLTNVSKKDSGTYKCIAQSNVNTTAEKSIKVVIKGHRISQETSYNDSRTIWYILVVSLVFLGVLIGYLSLLILFCKLRQQFKDITRNSEPQRRKIRRNLNGTDDFRSVVVSNNGLRNVGGNFDAYTRMT